MKKVISFLLFMAVIGLTGCATTGGGSSIANLNTGSDKLLATGDVGESMHAADVTKLQTLVATAKPHETANWKGEESGYTYIFTSQNIFVNSKGQACRTYTLLAKGIFTKKEMPAVTACRSNDGSWQASTDINQMNA